MRTTGGRPASDLTTRARIVDAAIDVFTRRGSDASVRTIAAAAGVSPGLITHHFGTKEALKAECDERVLDAYTQMNMAGIADPVSSMAVLDESDASQVEAVSVLGSYMMRAFLDGGDVARQFYQRLLNRTREIMSAAADRGLVRPECADDGHIRYLAASNLGFMLVQFILDPPGPSEGSFHHMMNHPELVDAMIDVLTKGVFTSDQYLAGYRSVIDKKEKNQQNV